MFCAIIINNGLILVVTSLSQCVSVANYEPAVAFLIRFFTSFSYI